MKASKRGFPPALMLSALFPNENPTVAALVKALTQICSRHGVSDGSPWSTRYSQVYGSLQGQRALQLHDMARALNVPDTGATLYDLILVAETYFCLVCALLALAHLELDPKALLKRLGSSSDDDVLLYLKRLFAGEEYRERGVIAPPHMEDFAWFLPYLSSAKDFRAWFSMLAFAFEDSSFSPGADEIQALHYELFPKNLLHATGQFYTSDWLAELLLHDVQWTPAETIVDPFCGCGVFLTAAVRRTRAVGESPVSILPNLLGFDISPSACSAALAALIINLASDIRAATSSVHLNIFSADILSTALVDRGSQRLLAEEIIMIDGTPVSVCKSGSSNSSNSLTQALKSFGLNLDTWVPPCTEASVFPDFTLSSDNLSTSRILGQRVALQARPADVLVTNPPWVGWEYIPRAYRKYLDPAWRVYDLFTASGRDAAFLKEDLATLSLAVVWDRFLRSGGRSAVVIRPATMRSDLAAKGTRRLSVFPGRDPLQLLHIREFHKVRVFAGATADAATWRLLKGEKTTFPIPVTVWDRTTPGWQPPNGASSNEVERHVRVHHCVATPTNPTDSSSRWSVIDKNEVLGLAKLVGANSYQPRLGIFTGGANGVFYLLPQAGNVGAPIGSYANVIERAKRSLRQMRMELENELVYSVLRGRDLNFWSSNPEQYILCTHTAETRMYPIPEVIMREEYPLAFQYLSSMRDILSERGGFSGWEQSIADSAFYALQRVGLYTFAPYKVCWKYIASEFTVCVIQSDSNDRPVIPNDKVIFIPFTDEAAAFFVAGVLSSTPIRKAISSSVSNRQISASCIKNLFIPEFDRNNALHLRIYKLCKTGHHMQAERNSAKVNEILRELDDAVAQLYEISNREQLAS